MSNECQARSYSGVGFIGAALAAWIGVSAAFGSCGSCNLTNVVSSKVEKKVNTRIGELEERLGQKISEIRPGDSNYLVPNQTYTINGQEYHLVPVEEQRP